MRGSNIVMTVATGGGLVNALQLQTSTEKKAGINPSKETSLSFNVRFSPRQIVLSKDQLSHSILSVHFHLLF